MSQFNKTHMFYIKMKFNVSILNCIGRWTKDLSQQEGEPSLGFMDMSPLDTPVD